MEKNSSKTPSEDDPHDDWTADLANLRPSGSHTGQPMGQGARAAPQGNPATSAALSGPSEAPETKG
ncbi:MAG: hypothetical protein Tp138OMZ00d2C19078261_34 [Prokaryotic dsDNA virus sp.]|nr:MAG: hypothetical protein Tp138OMZ00d2C19078261_34 [Prokaryotic dsDNA virus sp.]